MSGKPFVFVLGVDGRPLMPCTGKRARLLLERKRAVVRRIKPFVIQLKDRSADNCEFQDVELKIDPGSKFTGMCVARTEHNEVHVLKLLELEHRGQAISSALAARSALRHSRRARKTRYRKARFLNRTKPKGWLAPSLRHRIDTTMSWVSKMRKWAPITGLAVERVKFDMQKIRSPNIAGVQYQQGALFGYEVREYLLEKWHRTCAYCGAKDRPLQIEHIYPRARGGTNAISNLTLACQPCNQAKGATPVEIFLQDRPQVLAKLVAQAVKPLKDAAAVNATRNALFTALLATGLPVSTGTGAETKFNRSRLGIPKTHALDAACIGQVGQVHDWARPHLAIKCTGRGRYGRTAVNKHGTPTGYLMKTKRVFGFATGDLVHATINHRSDAPKQVLGRVSVRATGKFAVAVGKAIYNVNYQRCKIAQLADGYSYKLKTLTVLPSFPVTAILATI